MAQMSWCTVSAVLFPIVELVVKMPKTQGKILGAKGWH